MLLKIRDYTTGWFAVVIIAILIIPFAFFGINYYFGQPTEPLAAKINDVDISVNQYQRALRNVRAQLKNMFGNQANLPDDLIRENTITRLINSELLYQKARDMGLAATDDSVLTTISSIRQFQNNDSGFDKSLYEFHVNTLGMGPTEFEQQIRLDIMSEQLQSALSESTFVTQKEVQDHIALKDQKRDFNYLNLLVSSFKQDIDISDEEIQQYYATHQEEFQHLEKVKVEYIDMTMDKLAESVQLEPSEIEAFYVSNTANYSVPEKRKFWQFIVRKDKQANIEKKTKELAKVNELIEVLKNTDNFTNTAEQYVNNDADDVLVDAAESGLVAKGSQLVVEVENEIFSMALEDTSEGIETEDAYYIVRLKEIKHSVEKPFEEVKEQVEKDIKAEQARRKYFESAELLATSSYENPESLAVASDAIDIPISESNYFTLDAGDGLFNDVRLRQAAFSEDVLGEGNNSDVIEVTDQRIIVLRVQDRVPPGTLPLDEVREKVADSLRAKIAQEKIVEISNAIQAAMEEGKSLEQAAAEHDLEIESASDVTPNDINVSRSVVRTAFRITEPQKGETSFDSTLSGNGDYAFVELLAVNYPKEIKGKQVDDATKKLVKARAGSEWDTFFEDMKSEASIKTYQNNL